MTGTWHVNHHTSGTLVPSSTPQVYNVTKSVLDGRHWDIHDARNWYQISLTQGWDSYNGTFASATDVGKPTAHGPYTTTYPHSSGHTGYDHAEKETHEARPSAWFTTADMAGHPGSMKAPAYPSIEPLLDGQLNNVTNSLAGGSELIFRFARPILMSGVMFTALQNWNNPRHIFIFVRDGGTPENGSDKGPEWRRVARSHDGGYDYSFAATRHWWSSAGHGYAGLEFEFEGGAQMVQEIKIMALSKWQPYQIYWGEFAFKFEPVTTSVNLVQPGKSNQRLGSFVEYGGYPSPLMGELLSAMQKQLPENTQSTGMYTDSAGTQSWNSIGSTDNDIYIMLSDTVKPSLELIGDEVIQLVEGSPAFSDPGAKFTDNHDEQRTVIGVPLGPENGGLGPVDTTKQGTYTLVYNASDSSGNTAPPIERRVVVFNVMGQSQGDPYIKSANGKVTKIPDKHGYYRMFEHGDIYINTEVDKLDIEEQFDAFLVAKKFDISKLEGRKPITEGYWNKAMCIKSEGHTFSYDFFAECQMSSDNSGYFKTIVEEGGNHHNTERDMSLDDSVRKTITVSWTHSAYGKQSASLYWYDNPQVQNGMRFISQLIQNGQSTGLFVKNYKAKYMELESLEVGESKQMNSRLKAAKRAGKKLTHEKAVKAEGEEWFVSKGNKLVKN